MGFVSYPQARTSAQRLSTGRTYVWLLGLPNNTPPTPNIRSVRKSLIAEPPSHFSPISDGIGCLSVGTEQSQKDEMDGPQNGKRYPHNLADNAKSPVHDILLHTSLPSMSVHTATRVLILVRP